MKANTRIFKGLAKAGGVLGKGLIAGFAGTVAITISQMIEMQLTGRQMSDAPVKVGGKVFGTEPKGESKAEKEKLLSSDLKATPQTEEELEHNKEKFSQFMHFGYGTGWGVYRGALDLVGIHGPIADVALFGGVWGTAQIMLPETTGSKPITEWSAKQIAIDIWHHAVYAAAAGFVYESMRKAEKS